MKSQYEWNLSEIFKDKEAFLKEKQEVEKKINKAKSYESHLLDCKENLEQFFQLDEKISRSMDKMYLYSKRRVDLNGSDMEAQELYQLVKKLDIFYENTVIFLKPMLLENKEKVLQYIKESSFLENYAFQIQQLYDQEPHQLSKEQEEVVNILSETCFSHVSTYTTLKSLEMKWKEIHDEDGKLVPFSEGLYGKYYNSTSRKVRKEAHMTLYEGYANYQHTIASLLVSQMTSYANIAKLRHFSSALEMAMNVDHLKPTLYHNLIKVVEKYLPVVHRYYKIRKEQSGLKEFYTYDLNQSIDQKEKNYTMEQAMDLVLEALKPLGEDYVKILKNGYHSHWIDAYPKAGKYSSAYSAGGCYDTHPYILLNFNGKEVDVKSLAHESGHAMHTYYSNKENTYSNSVYTSFLSEIASTVNELLVSEYQLNHAQSEEEEIEVLDNLIRCFDASIFTQTMYAEFELWCYEQIEKGNPPTTERMNEYYAKLLKKYYGEEVLITDISKVGWSRISHFFIYHFYVYKYATGLSIATAFASAIINQEPGALENYKKFLKSGGRAYSDEILLDCGIDVNQITFIENAMKYFEKNVRLLEQEMKRR